MRAKHIMRYGHTCGVTDGVAELSVPILDEDDTAGAELDGTTAVGLDDTAGAELDGTTAVELDDKGGAELEGTGAADELDTGGTWTC
jgi:hypothetical protein